MLLCCLSSGFRFDNSNYNYSNTNTNVSSHLSKFCSIDLANMAKQDYNLNSVGSESEGDILKSKGNMKIRTRVCPAIIFLNNRAPMIENVRWIISKACTVECANCIKASTRSSISSVIYCYIYLPRMILTLSLVFRACDAKVSDSVTY
jgi:hypothetical protein